jgi:HSP20 family protein
VVRALVPGVAAEGIDIQFQNGVLTLRAKSDEPSLPEGASWLLHEVNAGEYVRQVTLPRAIDAEHTRTGFENGVLTLTMPKTAEAKPKQIRVASTPQLSAQH